MNPGASSERSAAGVVYAFAAYFLWGLLPLYFLLLAPVGPFEIVAWRILLALVFCALLILITRTWPRFVSILKQPRMLALTALAGVLIYVNWQTYLIGTLTGHVIETSLGYFINPIVTVLLGVIVLHERLRFPQWIAIGIALSAVVVIILGYGSVPWIALILAFSFGFYGLVKKQIGPGLDAVSGLTLETLWLTPVALVQLGIVAATSGIIVFTQDPGKIALVAAAGVVTAVPLLLFAAATRRSSLSVIGLLQFIAPIMQFIVGAWVLGEEMTAERWIGFSLVWLALIILTVDSLVAARRPRQVAEPI